MLDPPGGQLEVTGGRVPGVLGSLNAEVTAAKSRPLSLFSSDSLGWGGPETLRESALHTDTR